MTRTLRGLCPVVFCLIAFSLPFAAASEALANKRPRSYSTSAIEHALRVVDELETQAQRMTAEALQLAMGIEPELSLERLRQAHDFFEKVLHTLQKGDEELGLPVPVDPKLLEPLVALQAMWDRIDVPVQKILDSGQVSREELIEMAELDHKLVEISQRTEKAYEKKLQENQLISVATVNLASAEHLSFLVEQMATEFLFIAYDHEVEEQRQMLGENTKHFERTLQGLIHGDPELRLVPAPDIGIASQLRKVESIWNDIAGTLVSAAGGAQVDPATIQRITERLEPLYEEMEKSVTMLENF